MRLKSQENKNIVKNTVKNIVKDMVEAGSIVWGLRFWLGKDILGFVKNIDLDNSYGVAKMIHMDS